MASLFELKKSALAIRKKLLEMHFPVSSAHIGTGLSSIDILTLIYGRIRSTDDPFILSKGHGASALYATLHHFGLLSQAELDTYYRDGTLLPGHPAAKGHPAIPAATGSLGHGLPIAAGMAFANLKLHRNARRVFALLSDGECNEGSTWEAALFSGHHKLSNLTVAVDVNGLQGFGRTEDVLDLRPFDQKWESFGFKVVTVDGHDLDALHRAFETPHAQGPLCILAQTVKGKGVSFMENTLDWHYLSLKPDLFEKAMLEIKKLESELEASHAR